MRTPSPPSYLQSQPRLLERTALLIIIALAFALRLLYLGDADIWWDEGWSVWAARHTPTEIARLAAGDVHPPLYLWLLHGWQTVAGESEFAVRFLSAAAGTLTVVAVWCLGRHLFPGPAWVPLAATLLFALSRFAIWWSQETRMYMLGGLLVTLSLAFTVRLRWQPNLRALIGYLLTTIAALWTLYLVAFALVIQGLYWLWTVLGATSAPILPWRTRARAIAAWGALQVTVLLAWSPWLIYALPRMRSGSVQEEFNAGVYLQLYATLLAVGASTHIEAYGLPTTAVMALVVTGTAILAVRWLQKAHHSAFSGSALLLAFTLFVPLVSVWLITMLPREIGYLPKPEARYWLPFAPAFYLLLAWSVATVANLAGRFRLPVTGALLGGLVILSGWSLQDYYSARHPTDDYKSVALTLRAHHHPDDQVILHTNHPWPVFTYHRPGAFVGTLHLQEPGLPAAAGFLEPLWRDHSAIWLVANQDSLRTDPQRMIEGWLREYSRAHHEWRFGATRLLLFARDGERADNLLALAPNFTPTPPRQPLRESGVHLVGWEQPLRRVRAGDTIHVFLYIARDPTAAAATAVELRLGDPAIAQTVTDLPPGADMVRLPLAVRIPPDAPDGVYRWRLRLGATEAAQGTTRVTATPTTPSLEEVDPQHLVEATFGEPPMVRLLGYDLTQPPGQLLNVTLYWEVIETPLLSYKVFVHLVNDEGRVVAQSDDYPLRGERPTTTWRPGEILADDYPILLPSDMAAGTYTLAAGFYDGITGERLSPVHDGNGLAHPDDQIILGSVEVPER